MQPLGLAPALSTNIRPPCKLLKVANTVAYNSCDRKKVYSTGLSLTLRSSPLRLLNYGL